MTSPREAPLASLDLLRHITDRHVLDQLLAAEALTRADIAARTGISKPTISESMRRLESAGLVTEAGQQQGRRGRAGTFYSLRADVGFAVAVSASPDGLVAEARDVRGGLLARMEHDTPSTVTAAELNPLLLDFIRQALRSGSGPMLGSALGVAGPIDRESGRLIHLPNAPYLVDELDPRALLGELLGPELQIDNDVNWAALAEAREGTAADLDDFFYCHLGHGLGGAIVRGGEPVRGHIGLAGEIAHVHTAGPRGRNMKLVECFNAWGLLQEGSAGIDVPRLRAILEGRSAAERRTRDGVVEAVARALASVIAVLNPSGIVLGGPWSAAGEFHDRLAERLDQIAVLDTEVRRARLGESGPLIGARLAAVESAQSALTTPTGVAGARPR